MLNRGICVLAFKYLYITCYRTYFSTAMDSTNCEIEKGTDDRSCIDFCRQSYSPLTIVVLIRISLHINKTVRGTNADDTNTSL